MTIGELIKAARIAQGKTQKDVADAIGIRIDTISHIESGRFQGRFVTIVWIAQALNIDPKELFDLVPRPFVLSDC